MPDRLLARFMRSAGYVLTGNAPAAWFGPQQPLPPQAPPDVAGRQFDYPFGFNLAVTPRGQERTGFDELRGLADSYDLLRSVIETRKDQMERLTWRIRPRAFVQTGSTGDPRLSTLTQFFHCPDRRHGWATWLRMLLEDLLVIDAPALYKRRTRGGALYALELLDGATIKRLIDDWGRTPLPPAPAYQQILKGVPAVDYAADELIYAPRNPRVHKAYGFSPVEQVQMSVNIALRRQIYQLQYYTEGNVPEALIGVPENWNPDQIRQFQAYWDSLNAGDTAERRHAKFVPGGVAKTFVPVREPAMKDAFDEWLARIVCYVFSVPPSAFTGQVNRATADTAQDVALSEGMAPLQLWVKHIVDGVLAEDFASPDLEFAWDQDKDTDPAATASIASDYVKSGIKSINEIRAELGLPPVKGGEVPKIQTAQGLMPLTQASASGSAPAAKAASASAAGDKLERSNPNHFGPGERGGQFAPGGEGGSGTADHTVDTHLHIRNPLLVPVQEIILPEPSGTVLGTIRGLKLPGPEMPPEPKLPVPVDTPTESAPADEAPAEKPSQSDEQAKTEEKPPDFKVPKDQPSGDPKYSWTKKIVGALKDAMNSGEFKTAETIA
ncbi:MAG TPA: phage portal protein, partial [Stellaceae bacterium]|nr:phage portal protein [Stellaceae bacterium]